MDLFSFSGRANRMEFWLVGIGLSLLQLVISLLLGMAVGMVLSAVIDPARQPMAVAIFTVVIALAFFWPITAVAVRRSHDRNMSGWWYGLFALFGLAMIAWDQSLLIRGVPDESPEVMAGLFIAMFQVALYVLFLVILGLLPGTRGPNRFGAAPNSRQENYRAPPV